MCREIRRCPLVPHRKWWIPRGPQGGHHFLLFRGPQPWVLNVTQAGVVPLVTKQPVRPGSPGTPTRDRVMFPLVQVTSRLVEDAHLFRPFHAWAQAAPCPPGSAPCPPSPVCSGCPAASSPGSAAVPGPLPTGTSSLGHPVGHLHHRHLMKGALCPALARTGLGWVPVLFGSGRCLVTASGPVSLPTFLYCFIVEGILLTTRCMHAVSSDLTRVVNIPVSLNRGHFFVLGTFESLSSSSSIHMVLCCMRNCPIVP